MGKRIVLLPTEQRTPPQPAAEGSFEPGKDRRRLQRRNGMPRRIQPDRRSRGRRDLPDDVVDRRGGLRRGVTDRRRHRDRRFGLDPTLYDRLVELDL